jgi:hypothetical protein
MYKKITEYSSNVVPCVQFYTYQTFLGQKSQIFHRSSDQRSSYTSLVTKFDVNVSWSYL